MVSKSQSAAPQPQGNGGIMGSGVFAMFGSTVHCDAEDNSMFCELSKFVSGLIMVLFLLAIVYFVYALATGKFGSFGGGGKRTRGGGR